MKKLSKRRVNYNRSTRFRRTARRDRIRRILMAKRKLRIKERSYEIPYPMPQVKSTKAVLDPYNETYELVLKNLSDRSPLTYNIPQAAGQWLTIAPSTGTIGTESSAILSLTADETSLAQGNHFHDFTILTNGEDITIRAFTNVGVPDADPSALSFSHETSNSFYLEWTNNCTNETEVRIYQAQANLKPLSPTYTESAGSGFTYKVITGVTPGVTDYFWVEFANLDGISNHSTASKTLPDPPNANPVNITYSHITNSTIYVHWDNTCTNATEVRFWYSATNSQPGSYTTLGATETEMQLYQGLNVGTTYYFWIQFVNGDGSSTTLSGSAATTGGGTTATTYLNQIFDGTTNGYNIVPTNWSSATGSVIWPLSATKNVSSTRSWSCDAFKTPSSTTGPSSGHDSTATDGREAHPTTDFMYTEVSGQYNKRFLLRTPELDFSNSLSNNTLELTFWFHMYGASIGNLGVSATDSATNAGILAQVVAGSGFTSDTAGGLTMVYWDDNSDDGSSTSSGVRITGQQQTDGNGSTSVDAHWRKATIDLNALAGESSVYIWFFAKSGSSWPGDICIDDVKIIGEE